MPVTVARVPKESSESKESNCGEKFKNVCCMRVELLAWRDSVKTISKYPWIKAWELSKIVGTPWYEAQTFIKYYNKYFR